MYLSEHCTFNNRTAAAPAALSGKCRALTAYELKSLPAWGAMETDARNNWGSDARCNTNTLHTGGTLVGTSGSVSVTVTSGFTSGSTCTVTTTITVGIPDVIGGSGSWTASASFTNSEARSFSTEIKNEVQQTIQMNAPAGSTCRLDYESKTCYEPVKGRVTFSANGWFTFGYNSPTHGHYYWYMYIDDYASRGVASYSEFTGSLNAISKSHYNGHCT
ncbi:hypothetical protein B0H13DRAFT_2534316 [Mycena leptocephala]|nr:hypothetical protein B0H13DRAFT_2534316 [Mycena leptocephala]